MTPGSPSFFRSDATHPVACDGSSRRRDGCLQGARHVLGGRETLGGVACERLEDDAIELRRRSGAHLARRPHRLEKNPSQRLGVVVRLKQPTRCKQFPEDDPSREYVGSSRDPAPGELLGRQVAELALDAALRNADFARLSAQRKTEIFQCA